MPAPCVLCLLAALLAVADAQTTARSCYQCKNRNAGRCSDVPKPCPAGQGACLSVWEANTLVKGAVKNTGTFYSCVPSTILSRNISLFFGNGVYVEIQSQICSVNDCNNAFTPVWPIINTVYTGGRCPICFAPGRSSCSSKETLQCEGRASQCISISGQISEDDITIPFAAKGCATPHACAIEKGVILDSGVFTYQITQTECYTPSGAQRMLGPFGLGSILPSLAGLLAVKFLS
ncbi:phospholipase A2 inhibitor and Ly6/PLAUR domain-containing protein-like [Trachemys scripta elegans]|uniref:phospholipase A2 inhibitor and Ly6/PLAUR domain-containing protein-like n=1 Tax=Trachemys scripta elegans TaxID=31138 RepID=UPI001556D703|nr:phospholipase A2 inhibitor and Ly6/PLAUR domain-containing protein-like [Trachemys scripta elegans]